MWPARIGKRPRTPTPGPGAAITAQARRCPRERTSHLPKGKAGHFGEASCGFPFAPLDDTLGAGTQQRLSPHAPGSSDGLRTSTSPYSSRARTPGTRGVARTATSVPTLARRASTGRTSTRPTSARRTSEGRTSAERTSWRRTSAGRTSVVRTSTG
jgi:hypothetical protein